MLCCQCWVFRAPIETRMALCWSLVFFYTSEDYWGPSCELENSEQFHFLRLRITRGCLYVTIRPLGRLFLKIVEKCLFSVIMIYKLLSLFGVRASTVPVVIMFSHSSQEPREWTPLLFAIFVNLIFGRRGGEVPIVGPCCKFPITFLNEIKFSHKRQFLNIPWA